MEDEFLKQVKEVALEAAKEAGVLLMKGFDRVKVVEFKDRQDICTNLDLESEKIIIDKIKDNFPDHNISSEEAGEDNNNSDFNWVIDPIDGTKHYLRGLPLFCISIALVKEKEIIFGLVFNPATNEMFYATKGQGAFLNDKKIYVSDKEELADSFVFAELPTYKLLDEELKENIDKLEKLFKKSYRVRAFGSGALSLCYLAMGAAEAYIVFGNRTKLCDLAAGIVIVQEAGGKIINLGEGDLINQNSSATKEINIVASNNKVHEDILNLLKN
ncbi:MAG: inositol monophosphatase [Patescibacteria group bacterium]